VDALLGPVTSAETSAVAAVTNPEQVPLLCPTAGRESFATIGPYVFRNSLTNELQGRAMARYAVKEMGLKRFGILGPQDSYGEVLADAFRAEVEALGATVTAAVYYPPKTTDFRQAMATLGGRNPTVDKENERENQRREQQLEHDVRREVLKAFLPLSALGGQAATLAVAWAPFAEGYTNTLCPRSSEAVTRGLREAFETVRNPVRNEDLAAQALTRLPSESQGNTTSAALEDWEAVLDDLQASLLVTGAVIETDPPDEGGADDTWDFQVRLDTYSRLPGNNRMRSSSVTLRHQVFKQAEIVRGDRRFEALYIPGHSPEIPLLAAQLRFYDLKPQLLGGNLWDRESVLRDGGAAVEGAVFVTGFWADSPQPHVKGFVADFGTRFGRKPDYLAAQAYDAARLVLGSFATARNRSEVREHLANVRGFRGVSGETSFDGTGNADKKVPILQVENGRLKQLQ
jgi:ABC-type branched-subunit amino acid transport system substrate-binding protein